MDEALRSLRAGRMRGVRMLQKPAHRFLKAASPFLLLLVCFGGEAWAQASAVTTYPIVGTTLNGGASSTIAVTNTYQMLWPLNKNRHSCVIVNVGANTMFVTEGITTAQSPTTNAGPFPVLPNGQFTCQFGQTALTGQINITGTAGDAFYAAQF